MINHDGGTSSDSGASRGVDDVGVRVVVVDFHIPDMNHIPPPWPRSREGEYSMSQWRICI